MKLKKSHWIGIIAAGFLIVCSLVLFFLKIFDSGLLYFIFGIAVVVGILPFFIELILSLGKERKKEEMFLEFSRDLVEGVKSGTSISKSILNIKQKEYGELSPHVNKLANQISIGIPLKSAMKTFAMDVNSSTISRAVTLIIEAEKAGGKVETILESVAQSVGQVDKLRKERRAAIATLVVQGYIIFFIFIAIMLVMQFKILPITQGLDVGDGGDGLGLNLGGMSVGSGEAMNPEEMARPFLYLLITQGFFIGLVIGKLSEGSVRAGLKHSFILGIIAILISTGANIFL